MKALLPGKKTWLPAIFVCLFSVGYAQNITIDNANFQTGGIVYGQGSDIALPISISGCFATNNTFEVWMSNASGGFGSETRIGTYTGFYTSFVNGIIPAGTTPGTGYRVRIKSTSPVVVSAASDPFTVGSAVTGAVRSFTRPQFANRILRDSLAYGHCSGTGNQNLVLTTSLLGGLSVSGVLKNEITGGITPVTYDVSGNTTLALVRAYYTLIVRTNSGPLSATRAFHIINSDNKLTISTNGEQQGCLPETITYLIALDPNAGGIGNNFPGTRYVVNWGDTTAADVYTQCQLTSLGGQVNHIYNNTSCDSANVSFNVTITLLNPWFSASGSATQQSCDQPQVTSRAKIFKKPEAKFTIAQDTFCIKDTATFINTSDPGQAQLGGQCTNRADYYWFIDAVLVKDTIQAFFPPNFSYKFSTPGTHTIQLVVDNGSCGTATFNSIVCVEPELIPNFTMNGSDFFSSCVPGNFTPNNITTANTCRANQYLWIVRDAATNAIITPGVFYTVSSSLTDPAPAFNFLVPGNYSLQLQATNSCGTYLSPVKDVRIIEFAEVIMPGQRFYCDTATIYFQGNALHTPQYNTNNGGETYNWTITGGSYTYMASTTASHAFPVIRFNDYATYTVSVSFTNPCGTSTASQIIRFDRPVTARTTTGSKDTTVCYSTTTFPLSTAAFTGVADSLKWSTTGSGSFNDPKVINPTYSLSVPDRNAGFITLTLTVYPKQPTVCPVITDTLKLNIRPRNFGTDSTKTICNNISADYAPFSSVGGSSFTWTSTVLSGTVSGNTAIGTGNIIDVLNNSSAANDAIVKYTITPSFAGCTGEPFAYTVIVKPTPAFNTVAVSDTICSNTAANIQMNSGLSGVRYTWTSVIAGTITGNSTQLTPTTTNTITDALVNTGIADATVVYTISVFGPTGCAGETKQVTIVVHPTPTVANAGADEKLCNQTSVILAGNFATAGTGTWTILQGAGATLTNPNSPTTTLTALTAGTTYQLRWEISVGNGCATSTDEVTIINRPALTVAAAGADQVICDIINNGSVSLNGNINAARPFENVQWTLASQPAGGNGTFGNANVNSTSFSFSRAGVYVLAYTISNDAECTPSTDSVEIRAYDMPVAGTVSSPIGGNACVGNNITFSVTGYTGNITKWQYNTDPVSDGIWNDTIVTNPTITFTNALDTFQVRVIVRSSGFAEGCTSTDTSFHSQVNMAPVTVAGQTNADATVCANSNNGIITLSGHIGSVVRWESSANNGSSWNTISSTNTSVSYTNLATTTWFRAIVQSGVCAGIPSDTTVITVVNPVSTADAGIDKKLCNVTATTLTANAPLSTETSLWTQLPGGPNTVALSSTSNPNITASNLVPGSYSFEWKLANGICPDTKDTVIIINRPAITQANAGTDKVVCDFVSNTQEILSANVDPSRNFENGTWSILSEPAGGNGTFGNVNLANTAFAFAKSGVYQLQWEINNDAGCTATKDTIEIRVYDLPDAGTITAPSTEVCAGQNVTISLPSHTGVIQKWQYNPKPVNDNIWIDTAVATTPITFINVNDTFAVRVLVESAGKAAGCATVDTSNVITVNVAPPTQSGTTAPNATVCANSNSGTITLTGHVGNILRWESSTNSGATWNPVPVTAAAINYNNLSTTTWFRAVLQSGVCNGSPSTITVITVIPGVTAANAGADQKLCITNTASLSGNTPLPAETGLWSQVSGPNTATIASPASANTNISNLIAGTYIFEWKLANGTCPDTRDEVSITIRPAVTQANAGADIVVCDFVSNAQENLSANIDPARDFENGTWSIVSQPAGGNGTFGNVNLANTTFAFAKSGVHQLQWEINNDAGCTATKDTIEIRVYDLPVAGTVSTSTPEVCAGANVTFNLSSFTGVIQKWQYNPKPINDNIWFDTAATLSSITFPNGADTFAVRVLVESAGKADGCATVITSNVGVVNVAPPTVSGSTSPNATVCANNNSGTITLTGHVGNIVRWETSTNSGSTWNPVPVTAATFTYNNLSTTTWFRAIVQSGVCSGSPSTITIITVLPPATVADAGADQTLCNVATTTLTGNTPSAIETGTWVQASGPNTATFSSTTSPTTTISNLINGTYEFHWILANNICPQSIDAVIITNYPDVLNTIDINTVTICNGQTVTINGQVATGGNGAYQYQWQSSADGISWNDIPGINTQSITLLPNATVYLRRLVTAGPCNSISEKVLVIVQPSISNNTITAGNQTICTNTSATPIVGSTPTGANGIYFYQWQISTNGGTIWNDITGATNKDYTPGILISTIKLRRIVSSILCTGSQAHVSDTVTITVNPDAKAEYTATTNITCAPFNITGSTINNVAYPAQNSMYEWYVNNMLTGTGVNFPGYTISNHSDSVVIKLKAISLYGCRNDSMEMKFYTYYVPVPAFTATDTVACGPLTVTFNNNTPNQNLFTYFWNFGNGQTSNLENPGSITFVTSPMNIDTIYTVTLTASTTCGNVSTVQNIRVKSKPKALFAPSKTVGCSPLDVTFNNNSRGNNVTYFWDFDDGSTFTTTTAGTVQHQFITAVQDTFYVKLRATNECGSDSSIFSIIVSPNTIVIDFAVNGFQVNGCAPHTVSFINNSAGATGFNWNFGDGNTLVTTKNVDTITHIFQNAGIYTVRLEATNGCSDTTDFETVNVFARPNVSFTADKLTTCIGDSVRFTNLSDPAIGYSWFFGDGFTSNLTNPSHKYTSAGVYTVTLAGIRNYGPGNTCTDTSRQLITVVSSLPGSFTMSDSSSNCAPLSVTFTNKNTPSSLTVWDFGNGAKDTGDVVTYTFTLNGNYNVTMTVTSPGGCRYDAQKLVSVNSPQGTFTYDNGYICGATPVRFEVVGQNIDSLRWNFGDGTIITSTNRIVYYIYPQNGFYVPSVQIIGGANCRINLQGIDAIKVDNINAGFRFTENKNCGFTTAAFTDTSRAQPGIINYEWSFGDGATSILRNPVHDYLSTGNYNIRLIITSASGCKDTAVAPTFIKVNDKPIVAIQADSVGCQNAAMNFTSVINAIDPITTYNWNMGNSFMANTAGVQTSYGAPGVYNAQVIVGTSEGCFDTAYKLISINPAPNTKAGVDVALCRGQSTQLQAIGASIYSWSPTNGLSCITCPDPIATPNFTTKYVVTGTNGFGCSSKDTVEVSISQPFSMVTSPNRDICIGDSTRLTASGAQRYEWFPSTDLSDDSSATPMARPTVTTTYRVIGYDLTTCFTDTAFITIGVGNYPIVNAGTDKLLAAGATQRLTPTATNGPISVWQWTPATDLSCSVCPQPIATAKKDICYTATATNQYGCSGSDTVCIKVFCESSQIFIPNGFTPDGDGLNDVLMVRGTGIKQVKSFRIFNRWGQVVFERANFPANVQQYGWDGKTNGGVAAPPDVYVYTCDVICENDIPYTFKGNVAIIK